jgi:hypothetical protein
MAFLRECTRICYRCNKSVAVFELLTCRNDTHGYYCRRCSGPMLRQVKADEKRYFASRKKTTT